MNEKIIFKSLRAKNKYLVKFRDQNYILPLNIIPNFVLSGKNVVTFGLDSVEALMLVPQLWN